MLPPEQDIESRSVIWGSMQMLFMDTDPEFELEHIAKVCASSMYTLTELEEILFNEVQPSLRSNIFMNTTPEWRGFDTESLIELVLKKHRFRKRRQLFFSAYSKEYWLKLKSLISEKRNRD